MYIWHNSAIDYLKSIDAFGVICKNLDKNIHYIDHLLFINNTHLNKYFNVDKDIIDLGKNFQDKWYATGNTFGHTPDDFILVEKARIKKYQIVISYPPALSRYINAHDNRVTIFDICMDLYSNKLINDDIIKNIYYNHTVVYKSDNYTVLHKIASFSKIKDIYNTNRYEK